MTNNELIDAITTKFGNSVFEHTETYGMPEITIAPERIRELALFLKDSLGFVFLTDLCGIHYPNHEKAFGVIYHFHHFEKNIRLKVKAFIDTSNPEIPSLTPVFAAANWQERETYDFYGIVFTDHPNLTRILNVDYLDYFPLRKEYPLEDPTREDKDDRYFGR
jgi:NADH-quinone oxidoreductase subunit C